MSEQQRINICLTSLNQIYAMLRDDAEEWRSYVNLARTITNHLDSTTFMQQPDRTQEQIWAVSGLQRLASVDIDGGGLTDIMAWCTRQWLTIVQRHPQNVPALRGIGQAWLIRAHPIMARIGGADGSSSSSGSNGSQLSPNSWSANDEDQRQAEVEAQRRAGSADYVEARGYLLPAAEYLERAIAAAALEQSLSGDLLATPAETYCSLGNTSIPRNNEQYFRRPLQLLRAASTVPGYTLDDHLQRYLDSFGRLLE